MIETQAIVLGNRTLGESDRLVHFLTVSHGKIKGVAKGGRRFKNRFGSALEPMTHCNLFLYERRTGGLFQIQEAEIVRSYQELRENLNTILFACHFLNWVEAFLPEGDARPPCFEFLREFISLIATVKDWECLSRGFEVKLLDLSGYRPMFERCGKCGGMLEKKTVYFSPSEGKGLCGPCRPARDPSVFPLSPAALACYHQLLSLPPSKIGRLHLNEGVRRELRHLTHTYVRHLLGRDLGSLKR